MPAPLLIQQHPLAASLVILRRLGGHGCGQVRRQLGQADDADVVAYFPDHLALQMKIFWGVKYRCDGSWEEYMVDVAKDCGSHQEDAAQEYHHGNN